MKNQLLQLKNEMENELQQILTYWMENTIDDKNGGFIGSIDHLNNKNYEAPKGSVLNTRILWTFASAYRVTKNTAYLNVAEQAYQYIIDHFIDTKFGGIYWELDYMGKPKNPRKQIYALSFAIYSLAEYNRATGHQQALQHAVELYRVIEKYSLDPANNGYFEALTEDWQKMDDYRLSEKDANESKTMNTHLHIMEAYACLYRVWKDDQLAKSLKNLIELFINKFINTDYHLNLFFDDYWTLKSHDISFGHDIECSWLLHEAAEVLGDHSLVEKTKEIALGMVNSVIRAIDTDFGLYNEEDPIKKHMDTDKHWWPQAEAIVGFINAWQISGNDTYLQHAVNSWEFTKKYIIDHKNGEWFWKVNKAGIPSTEQEKAGFWKCPYHNSRACMELIERAL